MVLDPAATIARTGTVEDDVGESMAARGFQTLLLTLFAALALLLAAVGIFALMFQTVTRRTQEIGVRMALGAQRGEVVGLMVRHGMPLVAAGIGLGIAGSIALARVVRGLLFGVEPVDPVSYLAAVIILGGTALAACLLPASRATRIDPVVALRHE